MLDLALINAEMADGMYKKPVEVLAKEIPYEPLPPNMREAIMRPCRNFDMLPPATVEQMVPARLDK